MTTENDTTTTETTMAPGDHYAVGETMVGLATWLNAAAAAGERDRADAARRAAEAAKLALYLARKAALLDGVAAAGAKLGATITWREHGSGADVAIPVDGDLPGASLFVNVDVQREHDNGPCRDPSPGARMSITVGDYGDKTRFPEPKKGWDFAKIAGAMIDRAEAARRRNVATTVREENRLASKALVDGLNARFGLGPYSGIVAPCEHDGTKVVVNIKIAVDEATAAAVVELLVARGALKPVRS